MWKNNFYLARWALILAVFWMLLSGYFKPLLLAFGVLSVALVVYVQWRMDQIDHEQRRLSFRPRTLKYLMWLLGQIALSSMEVAKLVWGSPKNISPAISKLPISDIPPNRRVLYANSITLTPGTLSVDIDDEHVTVHALNASSLEDLKEGEMSGKVKQISGVKKS